MCSTLNDHMAKECACKCVHLCKRNNRLNNVSETSQHDLNMQTAMPVSFFNFAFINKKLHAEKSNHIRS